MPNPSAKYDPEGMAGIINIVLKQNVDLGISAGLTVGAANRDRYNASGNLGYQGGTLTTFSNLGIFNDERDIVGINDRERYDAAKRALLRRRSRTSIGDNGFRGENFSTNVDYKLNKTRRADERASRSTIAARSTIRATSYSRMNGTGAQTDNYVRPRDNESKGINFDYTIALKRTFEPRKHELGLELRFNRSHDEDATALWREPVPSASASTGTQVERQTEDVDAVTKSLTAQLDYTRPLGKTKLETGYKGNARWLDRDFLVRRTRSATGSGCRATLSNAFEFDEQVQAALRRAEPGRSGSRAPGGAARRVREPRLRARRRRATRTTTRASSRAASLSYNLTPSSQVKVSYSRRIRRPGTQELNPFPTFFDVQNVFIGNP